MRQAAPSSAPRVILAHQHRNRSPCQDEARRWDDDEPLQRFLAALDRHELEAVQLVWERPTSSGNELVPLEGEDEISIMEVVRAGGRGP